jgi:hypothetical protein
MTPRRAADGDGGVTVLLKDSEWEQFDGQRWLVTSFTPMATMEGGEVRAIDRTTPYASVSLRCEESPSELTGFITHKLDFAMLWIAFNERIEIPGVNSEVEYTDVPSRPGLFENSNLAAHGGGPDEEVHLIWTKQRYKSLGLPKLIVSVHPKGAFDIALRREHPDLVGLEGIARHKVMTRLIGPLLTLTPEVMYR